MCEVIDHCFCMPYSGFCIAEEHANLSSVKQLKLKTWRNFDEFDLFHATDDSRNRWPD